MAKLTVEEFLAKHPEIVVGREAVKKARESVPDPGNTWDFYTKPFNNVVLVQQYDADTKERLWVGVAIDDEDALSYYENVCSDTVECPECARQEEETGPELLLYLRDPKPDHDCGKFLKEKD